MVLERMSFFCFSGYRTTALGKSDICEKKEGDGEKGLREGQRRGFENF